MIKKTYPRIDYILDRFDQLRLENVLLLQFLVPMRRQPYACQRALLGQDDLMGEHSLVFLFCFVFSSLFSSLSYFFSQLENGKMREELGVRERERKSKGRCTIQL